MVDFSFLVGFWGNRVGKLVVGSFFIEGEGFVYCFLYTERRGVRVDREEL